MELAIEFSDSETLESTLSAMLPGLSIDLTGSEDVHVGKNVVVRLCLTNDTEEKMKEVVIANAFRSLTPTNITLNYGLAWDNDTLVISAGDLKPKQSVLVEVVYRADKVDATAHSSFEVSAKGLDTVTCELKTRIAAAK